MSKIILMSSMSIYCGFKRETEVTRVVQFLECGAGMIDCLECDGDGDWTKFHPEGAQMKCVNCKGTGKQLVSV